MKLSQILEVLKVRGGKLVTDQLPSTYVGNFDISNKKLTSLAGCPPTIKGHFNCSANYLTSLEHGPTGVDGDYYCQFNKLTSLEGIHKHLKKMQGIFFADVNPITSHVLGLFLINGCYMVNIDNGKVEVIMNKWLPKGRAGLIPCQNELIAAGLEEFAQV